MHEAEQMMQWSEGYWMSYKAERYKKNAPRYQEVDQR